MIKLGELWDALMLPAKDMDTNKLIDAKAVIKDAECEVLNIGCDEHFNILIQYAKEPEDEA